VAFARGIALDDASRDAAATDLAPLPFSLLLRGLANAGPARELLRWGARVGSAGLVDHVSLRTRAIDSAVAAAHDAGCRQVVLVGAGLDARAHRMTELARSKVFEVDHPATQELKRRRATRLPPAPVTYVALDFMQSSSLRDALASAGHDASAATVWVWEGVTMYLSPEATATTLADIARCSARESRLVMSYATPYLYGLASALRGPAFAAFRTLREPLVGLMPTSAARSMLEGEGFDVVSDESSPEWAWRYGGSARLARSFSSERVVVARRR
jgi:methyltransferase (TIGR00027 family)